MTKKRLEQQRPWFLATLFSVAFYACAEFGRLLSVPEHSYVSFWLPAGLFVAVLLLNPTRLWPWFMVAALPANLLFDLPHGTSLAATLGFYIANTVEAVLGAWLVRRFVAEKPELATLKEFFGLATCSALLSTTIGATIGAATLVASGMSHSFGAAWKIWWGNEAMAILLVAPLMLVWFAKPIARKQLLSQPLRLLEAVLLAGSLIGFTWYMLVVDKGINAPYKSRLMPLLLWAGLRFGLRGATAASFLLAMLMGFLTTHYLKGLTPAEIEAGAYVGTLQSFLVISVLIVLIPAIVIAERNRKVLALSESEEKFSKAFQSSPSGIAITEQATGRYIEVNESFCRLYGYAPREVVGRTSLDLGIWKDEADRERLLQPLRSSGTVRELELKTHARDGRPMVLSINAELVELGGKPCVVALLKDITERKQAEAALRRSEQLIREQYLELENFYRTTPVGLCLLSRDLEYLRINERLAAINGHPVEAHIGRTIQDMAPGVAPLIAPLYRQVLETGEPVVDREICGPSPLCPTDQRSWLVSYHPLKNTAGELYGVCGMVIDITERKLAEEARWQSEAEFRTTFENAAIGIALVNLEGRPIKSNRALQQMLGYTDEELQRMTFQEFTHPDDVRADLGLFSELIRGNRESYQIEKRYQRKGGGIVFTRLTVSVVRAETGKAQFAIGMVEDITEKRRLEEQLRQAQKMEALGTLAGGTAHEFNNMLGIIVGFAELSKVELDPAHPVQPHVAEILQAGARAKEIVQQVLAFSRLQKQERSVIRLHDAVYEAIKHVRNTVPETIEIQTDIAVGNSAILGNPTQIHQVITNICINAWHAMEDQGGVIKVAQKLVILDSAAVKIHPALSAGTYQRLSITDTGKGMNAATLARIFEPFFTTKELGKGTGLGLAVVHGIMQSHDGAVVASSEPGRGATFDLYFPAQTEAAVKPVATQAPTTQRGVGQHVLVVDDEPALVRVTAKHLQHLGYQVTGANSAAEALELVGQQRGQIDLVITDLTMPDMSGIALARELQVLQPDLPVILASGFDGNKTAETDRTPNIRTLLQKPFNANALAKTIQSVLAA